MSLDWKAREFKAAIVAKLVKNMDKATHLAEGYAKVKVPVDTGYLKSTIGTIPAEAKGDVVEGWLKADADYALPVEVGTSRTVAQPYLRPAIYDHADELVRIIEAG